ncbi:Hydrolase, alpha/beta fold family [hydrothermal vent metagenome]|uniref:Hydrolase, alpha/beta fold family n=1 Tax=hydrothermal vent metagenome TaxID=652676 RepID=A0A3B0RZ54_9ZZZZ
MAEFTTSDGLKLYYEDSGTGQPVLALAGLTRNARDFDFMAPHLPGVHLIRMDYRGRGKSDYDPDFNNYNIIREAHDAVELLDHLGLAQVAIIGTSRGGLIAMILAQMFKERLRGVILNDIGPDISLGGLERIIKYIGHDPDYASYDQAAEGLKSGLAKGFPDVSLERWRQHAEHLWQAQGGRLRLRYDAKLGDAFQAQVDSGEVPDLWPLFDCLTGLPLALIHGENSDLLEAATVEKMQARHPGMIVATVPNRGHVPFLDEAQAMTAIKALLELTL